MSTTMQQAFEARTTASSQRTRQTTPSTPKMSVAPRSAMDLVRELRERRARETAALSEQSEEAKARLEERIEEVSGFVDADEEFTFQLTELDRKKNRFPKGSVQAEEYRLEVERLTDARTTIREALTTIKNENPTAYEEGKRRYNFRREAIDLAEGNKNLMGSATSADIRNRIDSAVTAGLLIIVSERTETTFGFDQRMYEPVWPNDRSVAGVAQSFSELIGDLQQRRNRQDEAIVAMLGTKFWLQTRHESDGNGGTLPSELDQLKNDSATTRKLTEFLSGEGKRYIARVGRGVLVLENRSGNNVVAVKTSDVHAGKTLFTVPDRSSNVEGARMIIRSAAANVVANGMTISAEDLSGIWYDFLRRALEEDLKREQESAGRRETANGLRDISTLENPLTLTEIAEGGIGTAAVDILYEDPTVPGRPHPVTFQVTSNGTKFSVTGVVPGAEETIKRVKKDRTTRKILTTKAFLTEFIGREMPVAVLETDPVWSKVVRPLNREFERDWQLQREAERRNAAFVTKDNLDGLTAIEGTDGTYAVSATIRKNVAERGKKAEYVYNPTGFIVERNSSKVKIVWAVPGTSVNFANELRGELEISNLPFRMKLILGNSYWGIRRTDAPKHLQLTKNQQETEEPETTTTPTTGE